ncbi:hypothetical protein ABZ654_07515 [Streptomyces hygroscopicus]|uniref:hypothetical protein n=1 Tax=Streptomyces hygroscopicus TaxID=1912 RepID=UPI0033D84F24
MSVSDGDFSSDFESLRRKLDDLSDQLEKIEGRLGAVERKEREHGLKASCISLLGPLISLFRN